MIYPARVRFTNNFRPTLDVYEWCQQHQGIPAWFHPDFREIFLCPDFFRKSMDATQPPCLTVNKYQGNFYQNGDMMTNYQLPIVMHELAHFYIQKTVGTPSDSYDVNDCLRLNAGESVENAMNFEYYVASKFCLQWINRPAAQ